MKEKLAFVFILLFVGNLFSQTQDFFKPSDTLNISRRNAVVITESVIGGITLIGLNSLWYSDFERSKFHTIDDSNEWLQMDKLGHVFSSYQIGKFGAQILDWSGVSKDDQLLYGATLGFGFLTAVEVFDGYSQEWGFSWSDMFANAAGTGLYVGQELLWDEQRITLKYSFHRSPYASQRPDKLGSNVFEELLKDYNGQTYWLSGNLHAFFKNSKLPKWLNVAVGFGAEGMLTGEDETNIIGFNNQDRRRQFYLSLDVDLSRIETNSRTLRTIFDVLNVIKIPFPTVEISDKGKLKAHAVYF